MADMMEFPETFDEFVDSYGFIDTEEVYTNGSQLIPVFRVKQWLEHIKALSENKGEWIPVSERLPDRKKYSQGENTYIWERSVLVTSYFSWDDKKETFISYELAENVIDNNFLDKCVTAWMPLPEPYKSERGE